MLLLLFILPHFTRANFPEDPQPINIVPDDVTQMYSAFVGQESADSSAERQDVSIKLLTVMDKTLYVGARDNIYAIDLDSPHTEGVYFSKEKCHNYIKILLKRNDDTLFVCGTHAYNPTCRNYKIGTLEQEGDDIKGQGRCPYHPDADNFALFSGGNLYTGTISDFTGIDAVIYRSLGDSPFLRTAKQNSKWLKEPHFVHAFEHSDYVYFFFREISVEYHGVETVILPRVGRVCKNDKGGTMAVLDKQWTSFVKARLDCSIRGDSHFYFNLLQSVTDIIVIDGMDIVLAVFTTPKNSIPGSAVCAYKMEDIEKAFAGKFKEQKSSHSIWTAVPDGEVPMPRPGGCAGSGPLEGYASSNVLPDDTLNFISKHSLMHESVTTLNHKPWFQQTTIREHLIKITADSTAGPAKDYTVVFIGSETGKITKFLARTEKSETLDGSLFLEQMNVYNPDKCDYEGKSDRRIVDLQLDKEHGALFVAFSHCIIRVPLGNCQRYGTCKKSCIASRDPYCGWFDGSCVQVLPNAEGEFEQDIKHGNTDGMDDC
ncbi:semaphorin-6A-like [Tiliqua scincoides]|uniref:semaphorin-6A-like n=1 Tax=Tiliqua scincoides TaxID=71010 RepID=UPI003461DCBA